ncbi:MAG: TIGR02281 family clan AA aspartic protease [Rhizobiaceae bacterium]|nr:TIGR02281 family clan AA aspartic protease [Rhizobiaceae bacterium]
MSRRLTIVAIGLVGLVAIIFILRQSSGTLPSIGGDRFAYVIYMGIWATLIGSAVLARPEGLGHSLKQLVAWIGIFLIVMAAYSYRYELQDMASRITAGLIPGSPISAVDASGRNQITLIRNANGHFNARGTVQGESVTFLVDTGATDIVLSNEDAARAGIDVTQLRYNIPVSTANGMTTSARQNVDRLSIGPIALDNVTVMISRKGDLEGSLLGMNFINRLRSFEIRGDRMILTQ